MKIDAELLARLALIQLEGVGPVRYRKLLEHYGNASDIFNLPLRQLLRLPGFTESFAKKIHHKSGYERAEKELHFAINNHIRILQVQDPDYPHRLIQCPDHPVFLFYKGRADLNKQRVISVIGTRKNTSYGRQICEQLINDLKPFDVMVCSGLAQGIDAIAHNQCIRSGIPTIGVLAHGLDTIYPSTNRGLSSEMLEQGGLLTEFWSGSQAEKGNFPSRNRVVAGMSDATIVIETDIKGGSIITASQAFDYHRDVFCFPGRVQDPSSRGCHQLIRSLKAQLITSSTDLVEAMGWTSRKPLNAVQANLFQNLDDAEQIIMDALKKHADLHWDEIRQLTMLSLSQLSTALIQLELKGFIHNLPGKRFRVNTALLF